jgi:hypothetical protein
MGLRRRANASHNPDDQSISGYLQCDEETALKFFDLDGWSAVPTIPAVPSVDHDN